MMEVPQLYDPAMMPERTALDFGREHVKVRDRLLCQG